MKINKKQVEKVKNKMNKMLKKTSKNVIMYCKTNILFFTFVITSLFSASLLRYFTFKTFFSLSPFLADLAFILIIGSIGYFLKPKNQFKYFFTWSIIITLLCIINTVYYTNFLSFVSFSLLKTSLQLGDVSDAVIDNVMELKDFSYLYQILAMVFVNKYLKKKDYYNKVSKIEKGKIRALNTMVVGLITLGAFISTLSSTDISRLSKQWNREYVVMKYGIYVYQANDLLATIQAKLNPLFGYDEAARNFRIFYQEKEESPKNKYTGIFEGKNIIMIHAESIQKFLLDTSFNGEYVTPNLRKLASEGMYFSNFYAQESAGTSSDTEFTFNSSLLPATIGTVFINYFNREYVTTPKLLKEQGYYTFSMHGNKGSAWNRDVVHPKLGYDHFYHYNEDYDIDEEIGLGLSDKSFFRQSTEIIKQISEEHERWYGLLIMLTNHTPFSDINHYEELTGNYFDVSYQYEKVNEETGETETVTAPYMTDTKLGNYFKSAHYADEAIGEFMEELEEAGLLENTVVIIYGDHDNKLSEKQYERYYNYVPEEDRVMKCKKEQCNVPMDDYVYELNRSVPLIIWTKDMKGTKYNREVTKVMGMIDVQPTLGNMFGFYNKYALGHDIFSVDENVVVFPTGNWLSDNVYYNSAKQASRPLKMDTEVSQEEISRNTIYADKIINISNSIITYDLIKKIGENPENNLLEETPVGDGT